MFGAVADCIVGFLTNISYKAPFVIKAFTYLLTYLLTYFYVVAELHVMKRDMRMVLKTFTDSDLFSGYS